MTTLVISEEDHHGEQPIARENEGRALLDAGGRPSQAEGREFETRFSLLD